MSSSMKDIYDLYEDYIELCKKENIIPKSMRNENNEEEDWYKKAKELKKKYGWV